MKNKKLFTLLTVTLTIFTFSCFVIPACADTKKPMTADDFISECGDNIKEISVDQGKKLLEEGNGLFLDCRTEKEYKRGSVPNSINIQRGLLEFKIEKQAPEKDTRIIIYCKSGKRSALSACTLTRMGYTNILSMNGGWDAWVEAGYPVN
jgi:rhodanese-related sulfurtransferase